MVNGWTGGNNVKYGVNAKDFVVEDSHYYNMCDESEGRVMWQAEEGIFKKFDVTELETFEPKDPPKVELPWDDCGFTAPDISCSTFQVEPINITWDRINVNTKDTVVTEEFYGDCFGWQDWWTRKE